MYWKLIPEAPQLVLTPVTEQKSRGDFSQSRVPIPSILNPTWVLPVCDRARACGHWLAGAGQRVAFWMSCCPLVAGKAMRMTDLEQAAEAAPVTERTGVGQGRWPAL